MAFGFYGTFTTGQLQQLVDFSIIQETDLVDRGRWLSAQLTRNGVFTTEYDPQTHLPKSFSASSGSYAAKLLQAYRILGGTPENDFMLRSTDQPVFLTRGKNINTSTTATDPTAGYSDMLSNGRRIRGSQRFDRDVGVQVTKLKSWQLETIKRKREHLEFKIKRALDYSDQLQREIAVIEVLLDADQGRQVRDAIRDIRLTSIRNGAHNVVEDLIDIFGLNIGRVQDLTSPTDLDEEKSEALR
jgi:hypothetical protein